MAIIKCKMCGGDLELTSDSTVAVCGYCGTQQTVPTADNEKKITLFGRANRLRLANEFDKAAGVYESIVAEFPTEAEAYWGLVLCRYGIEYVDDPATGKKIPTCHRSSFDSVMDDSDFEQACENADVVARKVYREEAKAIEELRKDILEVSGREAPYDIFICYKETDDSGNRTIDSVIAQDVYNALTEKKYRVFFSRISLEDKLGTEYEPYIFAALNSAKVMLVFGTDYEHFNAVWVKNEWSRFLSLIKSGQKKILIPCYKNIDAYDMPKEFAKLQAQDMGKVGAIQDLLRDIEKIISKGEQPVAENTQSQQVIVQQQSVGPSIQSLLERGNLALEDNDWDKATKIFDEVLNTVPKCAEAYLGLLFANWKLPTWEEFEKVFASNAYDKLVADKNYQRVRQFSNDEFREKLDTLDKKYKGIRAEEAERIAERKRQEETRRKGLKLASKFIATSTIHTVGLKSNGTVVATTFRAIRASNTQFQLHDLGQSEVQGWRDIVAVAAGATHTIGLKSDGTVVATGYNVGGRCSVWGWHDIVAVDAGNAHTVGLKSDGTVVAVGYWNIPYYSSDYQLTKIKETDDAKREVQGWRDIVAVAAGGYHTVGLKLDGTVVATGGNEKGQCDVQGWHDIVAIDAGLEQTVGLKSDGTVVTTGSNDFGQCNVQGWKLFNNFATLEQERAEAKRKRQAEAAEAKRKRQAELTQDLPRLEKIRQELQAELDNMGFISGLFNRTSTTERLKIINEEISKVKRELEALNAKK